MSQGEDLPDPDKLPCDECGHVWFPGERPHGYIDQDDGVVVLCRLCFRQRLLSPAAPQDDDYL